VEETNEQLWKRWNDSGDAALRNELITRNMGIVHQVTIRVKHRFGLSEERRENAAQEIFLEFPRFLKRYNPELGVLLSTFLMSSCLQYVKTALRKDRLIREPLNHKLTHKVLSLDLPFSSDDRRSSIKNLTYRGDKSVKKIVEFRDQYQQLMKYFRFLPKRSQDLLLLRSRGWTLNQVGEKYNIGKERVRQVERQAIDKLRKHIFIANKKAAIQSAVPKAPTSPINCKHPHRIRRSEVFGRPRYYCPDCKSVWTFPGANGVAKEQLKIISHRVHKNTHLNNKRKRGIRESSKNKQVIRAHRLQENGLCGICGKRLPDSEFVLCLTCRAKRSFNTRRRRRNKKSTRPYRSKYDSVLQELGLLDRVS
jgi:RNA polymerase sigma factor (sigma-70 family)